MTAKILVVDDIPHNVKLLEIKLKNEYYNVICCYNALNAIEMAKSEHPDVILLDVMMPGMDGFEICKLLKKSYDTVHIPVIIITALTDMESRAHALSSGADDFLIKPVKDIQLFARLKSLLRLRVIVDELKLRSDTDAEVCESHKAEVMNYVDDTTGAKILMVGDDIIQAVQIKNKLKAYFNNVTLLDNMLKAFDHIQAENYDVVIIDIQISGNNGLKLCSQLRSQFATRFTPILILIDEDNVDIAMKAMEIGINDYITFPVNDNEMIARMITQIKRKRYQDALRLTMQSSIKMSIIDPLTGVYNRRYFDSYAKNLFMSNASAKKEFALIMIDIDYFKEVNDVFGHMVGDELLREVTSRLKNVIRISDLMARFGGEEFVVVLPNTNLEKATIVAERLRVSIADKEFILGTTKTKKTISLGVTVFHNDDTINSMLEKADKALYKAKELGRNRTVTELEL